MQMAPNEEHDRLQWLSNTHAGEAELSSLDL